MKANNKYNGHKNWNHWNVSLWLNNDETLYRRMMLCVHRSRTLDIAARLLKDLLHHDENTETPDGAPYTISSIRASMVGIKEQA